MWQGSDRELRRLRQAIATHCECISAMLGLPAQVCPSHVMLGDQATLDHLLYVYRMRGMFVQREFEASGEGWVLEAES